jgi:4-hydroxybenzoate polyprenyltransferase/phosphoglycolate phosphatase-like HAD superfamily hydrolase
LDPVPLVVDLDGTLVHTDLLHESALRSLRQQPWRVLAMPGWLGQGKAVLKQRLADQDGFAADALPYHAELLAWLRAQAGRRRLVLCTASDRALAQQVADHLGCFDEVMASDGRLNLSGPAKAQALVQRFGAQGFDYAGNSAADLAVWQQARQAVLVAAPAGVARRARALGNVTLEFDGPGGPDAGVQARAWLRALRPHQWLKNLLLAVPLLASHRIDLLPAWGLLALAFVAFSLCASAVYVANDLIDLDSDRRHERKRSRPFAAGLLPAWQGVLAVPLLLLAALLPALAVGPSFLAVLAVYFVLTCAYSLGLKRWLLVDCMVLAALYCLRIVAGAVVVGSGITFWMLTFSMFLFVSLAFVKRYAELATQRRRGEPSAPGRAYQADDAPLVQVLGISSGHAAAIVLALYLNSEPVRQLYRRSELVWLAVPVLLFWLSWMWAQAHRGRMHDDPLVYAVKDRASLAAGAVFFGVLILGALGWP